jgi:hypothetical protein
MKITKRSPYTKQMNTMEIPATHRQLWDWHTGIMIQVAMPNLTPDEREFLMTGYTPEDWIAMFGREPEDD